MTSTDSNHGAAFAAKDMARTAPIAKFGAIRTPTGRSARSRWSRTRASESSVHPVVPTTAWIPRSMRACTFASVALGTVKSTATRAPARSSSARSSPASSAATRSRSAAADTADTTVAPTRPAAPTTATLSAFSTVGEPTLACHHGLHAHSPRGPRHPRYGRPRGLRGPRPRARLGRAERGHRRLGRGRRRDHGGPRDLRRPRRVDARDPRGAPARLADRVPRRDPRRRGLPRPGRLLAGARVERGARRGSDRGLARPRAVAPRRRPLVARSPRDRSHRERGEHREHSEHGTHRRHRNRTGRAPPGRLAALGRRGGGRVRRGRTRRGGDLVVARGLLAPPRARRLRPRARRDRGALVRAGARRHGARPPRGRRGVRGAVRPPRTARRGARHGGARRRRPRRVLVATVRGPAHSGTARGRPRAARLSARRTERRRAAGALALGAVRELIARAPTAREPA